LGYDATARPSLPSSIPCRDRQPRSLGVPCVQGDVELILAERGIVISHETAQRWCKKFAASFANRVRRCRPRHGDKWPMDEGVPRTHDQQWECGAA